MRFRPCIDIHNGKVKQIIGGSLNDEKPNDKGSSAEENFVSERNAGYYAELYKAHNLSGGHIILLNKRGTYDYDLDLKQAKNALEAFPSGFQIGGGITAENASGFIASGASHVIVTSYVFKDGGINTDNLKALVKAVDKERIVLDLSCRKRDGRYFIVTDRWQRLTDTEVNEKVFCSLYKYCDEFLVHAVDAEGKKSGIDLELLKILSSSAEALCDYNNKKCNVITYAGGISSFEDIELIDKTGDGKIDFTIGSAIDLFGGNISFEQAAEYNN